MVTLDGALIFINVSSQLALGMTICLTYGAGSGAANIGAITEATRRMVGPCIVAVLVVERKIRRDARSTQLYTCSCVGVLARPSKVEDEGYV